jgi:sugar lactone lactonase YvrE
MDVWNMRRLAVSLALALFSVIALSGCSGNGDSGTVPFAALTSPDGTGLVAKFRAPAAITTDGTNLYLADTSYNLIRKVVIATGEVTTLAGTAGKSGTADGTGPAALFNTPSGITLSSDGTTLYVADTANNTIRKVALATGLVSTLAGKAGTSGTSDGSGTAAQFHFPAGIVTDGTNLYVTDRYNNTIRKVVIATGLVTTLAGTAGTSGATDGTGAAALFNSPSGIALSGDGADLYLADTANHTIRKVETATGVVTTLAGTAGTSGAVDGTGTAALFNFPAGIALSNDGTSLDLADTANHTIRRLELATGTVTTLAGTAGTSGSGNGTGTAAQFFSPKGIAADATNLYVADTANNTIRKVVIATGLVSTLVGRAP